MVYIRCLRCFKCGAEHSLEEVKLMRVIRCRRCSYSLDVEYDYDSIDRVILRQSFKREFPWHWKYWAFLPIEDVSKIVTMHEGGTPLFDARRLAKKLGFSRLYIKYEAANPTGSFKDRGSSLEISKAMEAGKEHIVTASTGNMGASLAAYAAFAGLKCRVFVPEIVAREKLRQISAYGARIQVVRGDYVRAMKKAEEAALDSEEIFLAGDYPWRCEGTKTAGYEIVDQLYWRSPDYVIVPIGNGTLISGLYGAFRDLRAVRLLTRIPRIVGVQAELCNPVVKALKSGVEEVIPVKDPDTIATAIACGDPIDGLGALRAIRESRGTGVSVSDAEILEARDELGANGIFVEPSGAVSYAGAKKIRKRLKGKYTVCMATGHGLKDQTGIRI